MSSLMIRLGNALGGANRDSTGLKKTVKFGDPSAVEQAKLYSVFSVIIMLAAWIAICEMEIVPPLFWPSPLEVMEKFYTLSTEGYRGYTLIVHIGISMYRVLSGFALGCVLGIPLGIGMGLNRIVRGGLDPFIELYRPVPPLAYIPLIIIWFGIGDRGKIVLLFLATFAIMVISSRAGVRSVTVEKIHAAYSLGATQRQVLRHVILVNALPEIFTGMRVAMGAAWGTLVAAEMVAASSGVGWMVLSAARFLRTDIVVMGIIVMGVIGYGFDLIMRKVESNLIPWKGKV